MRREVESAVRQRGAHVNANAFKKGTGMTDIWVFEEMSGADRGGRHSRAARHQPRLEQPFGATLRHRIFLTMPLDEGVGRVARGYPTQVTPRSAARTPPCMVTHTAAAMEA